MPHIRHLSRFAYKSGVFVLALFVVAVGVRLVMRSSIAQASLAQYYPSFCLGGWENPRAASGAPDTEMGAAKDSFTAANSAYLEPDVSSIVFCGYFAVEPRQHPPERAHVSFRWSLNAEDPQSFVPDVPYEPAPVTPPADTAPDTTPETTDTPPASPPSSETSENPTPPPSSDNTSSSPTSGESAPTQTPAEEVRAEPVSPPPAEVVPPPTPAGDSVPPPSPTSLLYSVAHAQESMPASPLSMADILQVSYTFDGVRWHKVGRVNPSNWNNFSVEIPTTSWDELQNLQIMVMPLPSLTERPGIYLDAVELEIESDLTFTETALEAGAAALSAVDSVADAVSNLASVFTAVSAPEAPRAEVSYTQKKEAPVERALVKKLSYRIAGSPVETTQNLPWYEDDVRDMYILKDKLPDPRYELSGDGMTLTVSGECRSPYFVLLTYRGTDDYIERPQTFASNYAGSCSGGTFSYTMSHLPIDTPRDVYYLLIGEQGDRGPWIPVTNLLPIEISTVEVAPDAVRE
jgi:hypothetical protein